MATHSLEDLCRDLIKLYIDRQDDDIKQTLSGEVSARTNADALLQTQIDELVAPSGEAPSAAEVENARIGADGVTYSTLGDAIRSQVTPIFKSGLAITYTDLIREGFINNNGVFIANAGYRTTPLIPCCASKISFISSYIASVASNYYNLWAYDEYEQPISAVLNVPSSTHAQELSVSLPEGTTYITFTTAANTNNSFLVIRSINELTLNMLNILKKELNLINSYPYSYAGVIIDNGNFRPHPTLQYRVTDFIPAVGKIYVKGKFSVVNEGYYNITGYDENKIFVENVIRFTTSHQDMEITLNPRTKYIRVMTTTSDVDNYLFNYPKSMGYVFDKIFDFDNNQLLFDEDYTATTFTTCDDETDLVNVADNYGIAITNRIEKGTIIKYIEFLYPQITITDTQYLIFVTDDGRVIEKFAITSYKTALNYVVKESGCLCYCRTGAGFVRGLYYKYNVGSEIAPDRTKVGSYIFNTQNAKNVGDKLNPLPHNDQTVNFVGCIVTGYAVNTNNSYIPKFASFLGDSITAGYVTIDGTAAFVERPFPRTVQRILGFDTQNKGYSSYPISSIGKPECLLSVYNTIASDADYIIVFAGTNDLYYGVPIGTTSDRTDISFCGAVYTLIDGLQTNYPNAQIVFMTPIHRNWEGPNTVSAKLIDYVNAIKDVCRMCSIPVIDLYSKSYFNWVTDTSKAMLSDGLHPTQEGYDFLGKVVAQYLKNVLLP